MKPIIDRFLSFTISKKLTVFALATILIFMSKITAEQWIDLSFVYIGTQGAIDIIKQIRNRY